MEIAKLQTSRCFQKASTFIHCGESARTHGCQVTYFTLSRYFRIAQVGSCVWGLCLFISGNPVVFLCGHIKHWYLLNILNWVLVFKLSAVHCCTHAKISIQGQLYRYSYHQISVMIHRHIDVSNTALLVTGSSTWHLMAKNSLRI